MFDSFMVIQRLQEVRITIVFMVLTILVFFILDNMLVASTSMANISGLVQLTWTLEMKDLGAAKQS